ncbi:hypothetical protein RRG08_015044 [Elysia crispata]|uniref:Uncharacterized protein n=1 Tax=Elysia crispata TaxID=231223 RepID=A0AAE1B5S8_9GAST|nr:hypothetical protein RRG08_015044 [Elysia crispata]
MVVESNLNNPPRVESILYIGIDRESLCGRLKHAWTEMSVESRRWMHKILATWAGHYLDLISLVRRAGESERCFT